MDGDFWRQKWRDRQIAFHRTSANPMLLKHFPALELDCGARVFVPLCGKTLDIHWLLTNGFRVAGAELVESAVIELFSELGVVPTIYEVGGLKRYHGAGIDIFVGDLFELGKDILGTVDAVYDRAALVALPANVRPRYAAHVAAITGRAPQILIAYVYDQSLLGGPPFSVTDEEVRRLAGVVYDATLLESADVEGGMKGVCPASERVWKLTKRG